ncbi:hypothetical protein D3P09_16695 [Paenibacillus pinisoli]|uniref:Uncharacterized protein n=1 Tax=Paenibacillus pinisoli TaxID=1276110 RepID=A0A3A6PFY9_9BACL|nr:hypothetical protein [Paenibacillus pinisoli]RJX39130.1 hypothetical protein D3P09_16695 [Paenibacillus pinisoli]
MRVMNKGLSSIAGVSITVLRQYWLIVGMIAFLINGFSIFSLYQMKHSSAAIMEVVVYISALLTLIMFIAGSAVWKKWRYTPEKQLVLLNILIWKTVIDAYLLFYVLGNRLELSAQDNGLAAVIFAAGVINACIVGINYRNKNKGEHTVQHSGKARFRLLGSIWGKLFLYLFVLIILRLITHSLGILTEGFSFLYVYHLALAQYYISAQWTGKTCMSRQSSQEGIAANEGHSGEGASRATTYARGTTLVIVFQYLCLAIWIFRLTDVSLSTLNPIWAGLYIVIFIALLKWIGHYAVAFIGHFFINSMLSLGSFIVLFKLGFYIAEQDSLDTEPGLLLFILCMLPIWIWWNYNIIARLNGRREG